MQSPSPGSEVHNPQSSIHWPSVWQFGLSLFGILALWGVSLLMLGSVVNALIIGDTSGAPALLLNAAGTAFAGLLLIPSAGYALLRLLDRPSTFRLHLRHSRWIILALPPVLLLGHWAANADVGTYFFLPVLHVLAAAISVAWLLALGLHGLSVGSPQLTWGVFNAGLVGAPFLSLVIEFVALVFLGIFAFLYIAQDPQVLETLWQLTENMPTGVSESGFDVLEPYIMRPGTLYIGLLFGALIVPLIEELFKPIGVWLLAGKNPSPATGFAAGLLSGAGYALFENFLLGAGAGEDWVMIAVARMGTSLIHILTAGLMGWAIVQAWRAKRYFLLGFTYLVAVSIHGLWNGFVILTAVPDLFGPEAAIPEVFEILGTAAPVVFAILILICFFLLLGFNAALRRATPKDDDIPKGDDILKRGDIIPPVQPQLVAEQYPEKETTYDGSYHQSD